VRSAGVIQSEKKTGDKIGRECTHTIKCLAAGTCYFAATAYDTYGKERIYSNEASKKIE
jgi:hypothetical protein